MTSRRNGDFFEYSIVYYLSINRINAEDDSKESVKRLINSFDLVKTTIAERVKLYKLIDRFFNRILKDRKIKSYYLGKDNDGKEGKPEDIYCKLDSDEIIGISCKRNNMSLKHQRPSSLHKFICEKHAKTYTEEYNALNDKWKKELTIYDKWSQIPKDKKDLLYKEFNDLYMNYLTKYVNTKDYYNFLFGIENKIIIHWVPNKNIINIHDYTRQNIPESMTTTMDSNNKLQIEFSNNIKATIRLHNASSSLNGNKLSLKYDTTSKTLNLLFDNYSIS